MTPSTTTPRPTGTSQAELLESTVSSYRQPLHRFAYSLAKDPHEADDLVQQAFYIYARKGGSLRDPSKLKSWLFTTLYREFLGRQRERKRVESREPDKLEAIIGFGETDFGRSLDGQLAVEALKEVDPTYRDPLSLFYLNDLSYKEIAASLSIPVGTVMSRLSRGKSRLRKVFHQKASRLPALS